MLKNISTPLFALLLLLQVAGCKKDDIEPPVDRTALPRTMSEFIKNNYELSILYAALVKTNLIDSLSQPGATTLFAPDNVAFGSMGIHSVKDVERMDVDSLRYQLQGHMLPGRIFIGQLPSQINYPYVSKSGRIMYVSAAGRAGGSADARLASVNGAGVRDGVKRNVGLTNGVIHVIGKAMQYHKGTVQDFLASNDRFSIFAAAMKKFNYWYGLKTVDPVTVFAPLNDVFLDRGIDADSINRMDPAQFREELFAIYHYNLATMRLFTPDAVMVSIINNQEVRAETGLIMGVYSVQPYVSWQYNTTSISISQYYENSFWTGNMDGGEYMQFGGVDEMAGDADHLTENGVVHAIKDLFLYPENLLK